MVKKAKSQNLESLTDEEVLQCRVRDLGLEITGSDLVPQVLELYKDLDAQGIKYHPPCYLADEWLTPDREPIIGIPFCLAHPRLKEIEKKMMLAVEGGTERHCLRLLRHECGHAINYAYELYKKTRWRELFGPFSSKYSDSYHYQPYSRRFVAHLEDNYAQCHPDEDFAETFAVWLTPNSRWKQKYANWPALVKLEYVDGLMKRLRSQKPKVAPPARPPWSARQMNSTLQTYYERKRKALGSYFQGYYDDCLKALFLQHPEKDPSYKASIVLRRHRQHIINQVSHWTGHRKYDINVLFGRFVRRCEALDLYFASNEIHDLIGVTALLTSIASGTLRISPKG